MLKQNKFYIIKSRYGKKGLYFYETDPMFSKLVMFIGAYKNVYKFYMIESNSYIVLDQFSASDCSFEEL